jgi:hypothetical protein
LQRAKLAGMSPVAQPPHQSLADEALWLGPANLVCIFKRFRRPDTFKNKNGVCVTPVDVGAFATKTVSKRW